MNRSLLLPAAYLADRLAGDPEWFPHPVRLIGLGISHGETLLRRPADSPARSFVNGLVLASALPAAAFLGTREILRLAHRHSPVLGDSLELAFAWTTLAARNLHDEASSVLEALIRNDLLSARSRLSRIVGRDTDSLDSHEISRALIETLAESASDGVVAPMFFLALGGAPLAMAYKAVNTLDSMIGHRTPRYLYFGKASARMDDAANFLPARLTAFALVAVSSFRARAWQTWRADGRLHKSPNAGQPEAAMAGALGIRLGGANTYDGELIQADEMGRSFPTPTANDARKALSLTSHLGLVVLAALTLIAFSRRRPRFSA